MAIQDKDINELILDDFVWVVRRELVSKAELARAIKARAKKSSILSQCHRVVLAGHNIDDVLKTVGNWEANQRIILHWEAKLTTTVVAEDVNLPVTGEDQVVGLGASYLPDSDRQIFDLLWNQNLLGRLDPKVRWLLITGELSKLVLVI